MRLQLIMLRSLPRLAALLALGLSGLLHAAVLPDDRADVFWSNYKGGGMDIGGKSILVRKKFAESVSVQAEYFIDTVSGASIDVLSNASVIKDKRNQKSVGVDYIRGKTSYALSYANSKETDYISDTWHASLSQDMFGDLTTVSFGYTRGSDRVSQRSGAVISSVGQADRRSYDLGLSQVITKNLLGSLSAEVITDEGFLNNPYRFTRYSDSTDARGWALQPELYPKTRTSTAVTGRVRYYLWYRAAAAASYRYFTDTWGIRGSTVELTYTHPISNRWIFEGRARLYKQGAANFYSDLFPRRDALNFIGRDKDLAASKNTTLGIKATYAFLPEGWKFLKRGTVTVDYSRIQFKYDDFRDIKDFGIGNGFAAGAEPLYKFNANVVQVYASIFF
jgi:Protein of unknown function (DUF3570)